MKKSKTERYEAAIKQKLQNLTIYHLFSMKFHQFCNSKQPYFVLKSNLGIREDDRRFDDLLQAFWRYTSVDAAYQHFMGFLPQGVTPVEKPVPRNCTTCYFLGSDDDGADFTSNSWPICSKTYLVDGLNDKSDDPAFPFAEEQSCHVPNFWAYVDLDQELKLMYDKEMLDRERAGLPCDYPLTLQRFTEKYPSQG